MSFAGLDSRRRTPADAEAAPHEQTDRNFAEAVFCPRTLSSMTAR